MSDRLHCPGCGIPTIEGGPDTTEEELYCNRCVEELERNMSTNKLAAPVGGAQFTPGPTCTCEIVMRTGETLDSSLGNRPCSDISRILLCPFHTAAPAMYEALSMAHNVLYMLKQGFPSEALCSENNPWGQDTGTLPDGKKVSRSAYMKKADEATAVALSQAEGR